VITLQEDEKWCTAFQLCRPLFVTASERCRDRRVELRNVLFQRRLDFGKLSGRCQRDVFDLHHPLCESRIGHGSLHSGLQHSQRGKADYDWETHDD
jgi:hypothetical protein